MNKYYVTATDRFMSEWGMAEGKINKLVIECNSLGEAERVYANLKRCPEMEYVNLTHKKPCYSPSRYVVSYKTKYYMPVWFE